MLYAFIGVTCALVIFVLVSYFVMKKTYRFQIENQTIVVKNAGSNLSIFSGEKLIRFSNSPDLLKGESVEFKLGEKVFTLKCKCNTFGNKIRMEIYQDKNLICDNGVLLTKKIKNKD